MRRSRHRNNIERENRKSKREFRNLVLSSFVFPLAVTMAGNIFNKVSYEKRISKVETKVEDIKDIKHTLNDHTKELSGMQGDLREMNIYQMNNAITVVPTRLLVSSLNLSSNANIYGGTIGNIKARATDMAAASLDGSNNFTFQDLISKKVVIPYTEGDEKVYFCGQYNSQMHWDGKCVLNVYKNNRLYFITEATYVDGTLIAYLQVFSSNDNKQWIVSNRYVDSTGNYGSTAYYDKKENFKKNFNDSKVTGADLYLADQFITNYVSYGDTTKMNSYYKGYTSGGLYNDDTGEAYLIKFDKKGYVLTLYYGCFKNGNFEDNSGKAWEITRKAKDASKQETMKYMYFHGKFTDGKMVDGDGENNLSQKRINEIIKGNTFDIDLKWKKYS